MSIQDEPYDDQRHDFKHAPSGGASSGVFFWVIACAAVIILSLLVVYRVTR